MKQPDAIKVPDGSRVIVTTLEPTAKIEDKFLSEGIEDGAVEFVRARRGVLLNNSNSNHPTTQLP